MKAKTPEQRERKRLYDIAYIQKNKERYDLNHIEYRKAQRELINARQNIRLHQLKDTIIDHYGAKCNCPGCKEKHREFLTIDHIQNGGKEHRKISGGPNAIYTDIIKQGFPKDKYQILCSNCNGAKGTKGYCPHWIEQKIISKTDIPHLIKIRNVKVQCQQ